MGVIIDNDRVGVDRVGVLIGSVLKGIYLKKVYNDRVCVDRVGVDRVSVIIVNDRVCVSTSPRPPRGLSSSRSRPCSCAQENGEMICGVREGG